MFCPPHFRFVLLWYSSQASPVHWPAWICSVGIFDAGAENHLGQCQEVDGNIAASPVKAMGFRYCQNKTSQRHPQRKENNSKAMKSPGSPGAHTGRLSVHFDFSSQATTGLIYTLKHHFQLQTIQESWRILLRNTQQKVAKRLCRSMQYYNTQNYSP